MKLESSAFHHNQTIPAVYTCDGDNVSPPLSWSGSPENTQSLALIVDDPDAPGGDFVHWLAWNIPSSITGIEKAALAVGAIQGTTDFGKPGYGGPCPPSGNHRYQFKLYALDTMLELLTTTGKKDLEKAMDGHVLDQATLIGRYARVLK